ncbi:MAG: hypothetical protein ACK5DG_07890 [Chitinophagaceae bacterium]|jgi:hypothetical protein
MELENLKTIWKDVGITVQGTSAEELEQLLSKKSKSPIAKLKRNLLWELIAVAVLYGITIIYYLSANKPGMLYMVTMLLVVGALYGWYYISKRKLLNSMECVTCEVKSNLSTQLTTLEKLVKLYLWVGTLLVPFLLILSFLVGLFFSDNGELLAKLGNEIIIILVIWALISFVLTIPVYFLNKWYINLLYGRHVKKLRQIVNEMNELPFKN